MQIEFKQHHYPESEALKLRLEPFLNRPDVQEQLAAVARYIFPQGTPRPQAAYGMDTIPLMNFGLSDITDGDPYNYANAILSATKVARTDAAMPRATRIGLESVAGQLMTITETQKGACKLKQDILIAAKAAGINVQQKG